MTETTSPLSAIPMSPFGKAGDLLFLSGQLAFDTNGNLPDGIEAQATQCLANIDLTLMMK